MFSHAVTAFITEQQASRFLEECLIGSAVFDKHPEEMNFGPHVWTFHPHCVQHTIGKHLSHCLCLAALNCCVRRLGNCWTESRQRLDTTSQILQRLTLEIKYLGFLHIYTPSCWKATQAVSKSVHFANPNSFHNLSSLTHLRGKWIDKTLLNFRLLLSSCAEMKSASLNGHCSFFQL